LQLKSEKFLFIFWNNFAKVSNFGKVETNLNRVTTIVFVML